MHPGSTKIIHANTFAYPNEYPKHLTDWGMYAKKFAYRNGLREVVCMHPYVIVLFTDAKDVGFTQDFDTSVFAPR